jgi:hypothetical protein
MSMLDMVQGLNIYQRAQEAAGPTIEVELVRSNHGPALQ